MKYMGIGCYYCGGELYENIEKTLNSGEIRIGICPECAEKVRHQLLLQEKRIQELEKELFIAQKQLEDKCYLKKEVMVCAACYRVICTCIGQHTVSTIKVTRHKLKELNYEHPKYWIADEERAAKIQ